MLRMRLIEKHAVDRVPTTKVIASLCYLSVMHQYTTVVDRTK